MRAGVPFVLRFSSKFFLEILPAALASVIGGFLFAQYHTSAPDPKPVPVAATSVPADRLAAMVEEEHTMLLDYLKREKVGEKPGTKPRPSSAKAPAAKVRPRTAAAAMPSASVKVAMAAVPMPVPAPFAAPVTVAAPAVPAAPAAATAAVGAPAIPGAPAVADPGAPLVIAAPAPASDDPRVLAERDRAGLAEIKPRAPESDSVLGSVLSKASAIKDKALNATGDAVTFVVHDIPSAVLPSRSKPPEETAGAGAGDVPPPPASAPAPAQRFSEQTW